MFITFRIFQAPKNLSPYIVQAVSLFSEMPDAPVDKLARWQDRWDTGKTGWHKDTVNQNLSKHFEKLTKGQKDLKFLFPLCGKTLDMIWVYKQVRSILRKSEIFSLNHKRLCISIHCNGPPTGTPSDWS